MRRLISSLVVMTALAAIPFFIATAATTPISDTKSTTVAQGCVSAQVTLQRLQYSDAATRINRGRTYETLLSKLMTPLNSRMASNSYNTQATQLTEITSRYQEEFSNFKQLYEEYDKTVTKVVKMKCRSQPRAFYDALLQAQSQRTNVATSVSSLDKIIEEYRKAASDARKAVES